MVVHEIAFHEPGKSSGNAETQSDRLGMVLPTPPLEWSEDYLQVSIADFRTRVADLDFDTIARLDHRHRNLVTTVSEGVGDEVTQDLTDPPRIGVDADRAVVCLDCDGMVYDLQYSLHLLCEIKSAWCDHDLGYVVAICD